MGAVEDVLVSTAARYGGDLAAVEANGYAAHRLGIWRRGRFRYCAAQMETWEKERKSSILDTVYAICFQLHIFSKSFDAPL